MRAIQWCLAAALLLSISLQLKAASVEWSAGPELPVSLQEIYPTSNGQAIYVAGGIVGRAASGELNISDKVYWLEANTKAWKQHSQLPAKRHHAQTIAHENELYILGGFVESASGQWTNTSDFLMFDTYSQTWKALPPMPKALSETTFAIIEGRLHVAGGRSPLQQKNGGWRDNMDVDWHFVFDFQSQQWKTLAPLPTARNSTCSVVLNNKWHVIAGRTVNGGNSAEHHVYDASKDTWSRLAKLPQAQGALACTVLNEQIYAMGGEFFEGAGGIYNELWVYSPEQDVWHKKGTLPTPRHGHGAVTLNKQLYLIGGASGVGANSTLNTLDILQLKVED